MINLNSQNTRHTNTLSQQREDIWSKGGRSVKKEETQTDRNTQMGKQREREKNLVLRQALKPSSDPWQLQRGYHVFSKHVLSKELTALLKLGNIKSYFALEMIKLLPPTRPMTGLGEFLAFRMFRTLELEGPLRDHQSNLTFKEVQEGVRVCSVSFTGLVLVVDPVLGHRSPDPCTIAVFPKGTAMMITIPYNLLC